ncbi:MAG: toxin FitB [Acetobacteraceae bacterium]|jgi:predicted nucleic acid-binding protein|nr:toxin FitB [Acetobacteraceae bacterium]
MILVDTNVISELVKPAPNPAVVAYLDGLAPEAVFTAAVCEAEIRYGLARMPVGRRRDELITRITTFFDAGFQDQVLPFDRACAALYGEIRHTRQAAGKPITVEDAMIAATARAYGVQAIVTRNTKDFEDCGVKLIDAWLPI